MNTEPTEQVTFKVPKRVLDIIRQEARERSAAQKCDIKYTDLIRDIIESGKWRLGC